jgi:hypothetical protein
MVHVQIRCDTEIMMESSGESYEVDIEEEGNISFQPSGRNDHKSDDTS